MPISDDPDVVGLFSVPLSHERVLYVAGEETLSILKGLLSFPYQGSISEPTFRVLKGIIKGFEVKAWVFSFSNTLGNSPEEVIVVTPVVPHFPTHWVNFWNVQVRWEICTLLFPVVDKSSESIGGHHRPQFINWRRDSGVSLLNEQGEWPCGTRLPLMYVTASSSDILSTVLSWCSWRITVSGMSGLGAATTGFPSGSTVWIRELNVSYIRKT